MQADIIQVTKLLDLGGGFGVTGAGDNVYIPRSVTSAAGVAVGQRYHAMLVPNVYAPERNPYMAVRVMPTAGGDFTVSHDDPLIEDPQAFIDDMGGATCEDADLAETAAPPKYDDVAEWALVRVQSGGSWTLRGLMHDCFGAGQWCRDTHIRYMVAISNKLNAAHRRGELARAEVRQAADQIKPSRIVWAANWKDLF